MIFRVYSPLKVLLGGGGGARQTAEETTGLSGSHRRAQWTENIVQVRDTLDFVAPDLWRRSGQAGALEATCRLYGARLVRTPSFDS